MNLATAGLMRKWRMEDDMATETPSTWRKFRQTLSMSSRLGFVIWLAVSLESEATGSQRGTFEWAFSMNKPLKVHIIFSASSHNILKKYKDALEDLDCSQSGR